MGELILETDSRSEAKWKRLMRENLEYRKAKKGLPQLYRVLSQTMRERLDALQEAEDAQISLRAELDLQRVGAQDAIDAYGRALDIREVLVADGADAKLVSQAQLAVDAGVEAMRNSLEHVQKCAVDAVRVEAMAKGGFSLGSVRSILTQVGKLMYEICGDENAHLAVELERRIMSDISVCVQEGGTMLTPDMDVRLMDDMVPRVE